MPRKARNTRKQNRLSRACSCVGLRGVRDYASNVATTGAWSLVPTSACTGHAVARAASASLAKHVVEAPADVALPHVAPRRPPREQAVVVGIERAADVDEPAAEDPLDQRALLGQLADGARLPLLRVHVAVGARHVHVAAAAPAAPAAALVRRRVGVQRLEKSPSWRGSPCRRSARRPTRRSAHRRRATSTATMRFS